MKEPYNKEFKKENLKINKEKKMKLKNDLNYRNFT